MSKHTYPTAPKPRLLRLPMIIGNPKANPPIAPLIPVSNSSWWAGVKSGRYPKGMKLGPKTTVWLEKDIKDLIERLSEEVA